MDRISAKILNELLAPDKEPPLRPARKDEQQPATDHWTRPILIERAAYLGKLARYGQGSASETIKEYPQHSAMLRFHGRDGEPERDENSAHILYVLDGRATLLTGGTRTSGTLRDAISHSLRPGDVVHIPAGQTHQMLIAGENTVTCLAFKIQENR